MTTAVPHANKQIVPVSFASPFAFVAAAVAADKEQEDPLLMVTTLTVRALVR